MNLNSSKSLSKTIGFLFLGAFYLIQGCAANRGAVTSAHVLGYEKVNGKIFQPKLHPVALTPSARSLVSPEDLCRLHKIDFKEHFFAFSRFREGERLEIGGRPYDPDILSAYFEDSGRGDLRKNFDDGAFWRSISVLGGVGGLAVLVTGQAFKNQAVRGSLSAAGALGFVASLPVGIWGAGRRSAAVSEFNEWVCAVPLSSTAEALLLPVPSSQDGIVEAPAKNRDELFYRTFRIDFSPFTVGGKYYHYDVLEPYLTRVGHPELVGPIQRAHGVRAFGAGLLFVGVLGVIWAVDQALPQEGSPVPSSAWEYIQPVFWTSLSAAGVGQGVRMLGQFEIDRQRDTYNQALKVKYNLKF